MAVSPVGGGTAPINPVGPITPCPQVTPLYDAITFAGSFPPETPKGAGHYDSSSQSHLRLPLRQTFRGSLETPAPDITSTLKHIVTEVTRLSADGMY